MALHYRETLPRRELQDVLTTAVAWSLRGGINAGIFIRLCRLLFYLLPVRAITRAAVYVWAEVLLLIAHNRAT